jgi:hypothetical protein
MPNFPHELVTKYVPVHSSLSMLFNACPGPYFQRILHTFRLETADRDTVEPLLVDTNIQSQICHFYSFHFDQDAS